MREIKFEYLANYKDDDGVIHWHKEVLTLPQIEQGFWQGGLDACFTSNPENTYKRQFTGLLDKNGKEIYEGDIVKFTRQQGYSHLHKGSIAAIYWFNFQYCGFGFDENIPLTMKKSREIEIIGNIYENPELLANPTP